MIEVKKAWKANSEREIELILKIMKYERALLDIANWTMPPPNSKGEPLWLTHGSNGERDYIIKTANEALS